MLPVSVVIPIRNGAPLLRYQLEALASQDFDGEWETIVADNGSTDNLPEVIDEFAGRVPRLRLVDARALKGVSYARNAGAKASAGSHLLFIDADDVVAPNFVRVMEDALKHSPFVAARLDPEPLNPTSRPGLHAPAQTRELNHAYGFLPWCGTAFGISRAAFDQAGGFDEAMLIGEDTDFSWRAQLASVPLELAPDAVVQIRHRQGLRANFGRGRFYATAGPLLYRKYRHQGMPRRNWKAVLRFYGGFFKSTVLIRSKRDLESWLFLAGTRVGILEGCVRYRVLYL